MISFIYTLLNQFNPWRAAPPLVNNNNFPISRTGDPEIPDLLPASPPVGSNMSPNPSAQISRAIINSDSSLPQVGLPFIGGVEELIPPTPPVRSLPISRESNESDD